MADANYLSRRPRAACLTGAAISAAVGAVTAIVVTLGGSDSSGFLSFIVPGAALTGLVAGAISFLSGSLIYRSLRRVASRGWARASAVLAATFSSAVVVAVPFLLIPAIDGVRSTVVIAAGVAAVCAVIAVRPLEKAIGTVSP